MGGRNERSEGKIGGPWREAITPKVDYEVRRGVNGSRRKAKVRFVGFTTAKETRRRVEKCFGFSTVTTGEGSDGNGKAGSGF